MYFNGITGDRLTIFNVKRTDSGNFSCFSLDENQILLESINFVYVKFNPILTLSVNNKALRPGEIISFGNLPNLSISCTAINSRPSVNLRIFGADSGANLPFIPANSRSSNPLLFCDSTEVCQSVLIVRLNPGFATKFSIRNITCLATNTTFPFELSTSVSHLLDFNSIFFIKLFFYFFFNLFFSNQMTRV